MKFGRKSSTEKSLDGALDDPVQDERLSPVEVRERAVAGAVIDVLQGMGVRIVGLVGTLVLARLLTPEEFGIVAFGMTFLVIATFLADGGIGSGLIRRVDPPTRADLRALLGFQLGLSSALAVAISAALLPFGELGEVTALMVVALPLMAVRAPGVIMLERKLSYRPLALVMIIESIVYYVWAILLVLQGWGVWGLASASVVRALTGSVVLLFSHPSARLIPSFSLTLVRPLLGFGFRYQAVGVANMLRELGTNAAIAIVAGVAALGIWSVAFRILQIPLLFLGSLWRVSFPGMSQLVAARENVGQTIERVVAVVAVASGLILAPLVAATPAWVPALLGEQWSDAVAVIPPASLHLMVMGTISVALLGYLWAMGDASAVLRATLVGMPLMAAVMIPLLMVIGVPAVGFGWLASGVGEATVLIRSARKTADFSISSRLIPPTIFAAMGATIGWVVSSEVGETIFGGLVGALFAAAVYLLALWVWHRSYLLDTVHLSLRGMRQVLKSSA
jgi:O-antigen/teichoic acid export membrane protein